MQSMCYTSTTSPLPQNLFPPRLRPPSLIFCFLFSRAELTDSAVLLSPGEEGRRKKEKKGEEKRNIRVQAGSSTRTFVDL